jgi:hypothetical protein
VLNFRKSVVRRVRILSRLSQGKNANSTGKFGKLSDEQRRTLLAIAEKCPVHRTPSLPLQIPTDAAT